MKGGVLPHFPSLYILGVRMKLQSCLPTADVSHAARGWEAFSG